MTEHDTWLARQIEDAIEPELPICDPHHHLWNSSNRRYLLEDLFKDIGGGHNIIRTVFVESSSAYAGAMDQVMEPVEETRFTHAITDRNESRKYGPTLVADGIVGFANLILGAKVAAVLEEHIAASDRFRGIRQICSWDSDSAIRSMSVPHLLLDKHFREGFACLKRYELTFETFIYHPQLMDFVDLARSFPDVTLILNHIGGPLGVGFYAGKRDQVFLEWKKYMKLLVACPNVYVKLGGQGMPVCGFAWDERKTPPDSVELADAMAPYYLWCIETFGVERCMFESNFPVDRASYSYTVLWNAFKRICTGFSGGERASLFHDTAAKVYRLKADRHESG
jgi:L-fuconolactonase